MREPTIEMDLRPGDRVLLTRDTHWPGVGRARHSRTKDAGKVPAGAAGRLYVFSGMWALRFDDYRNDEDWPCLIGFFNARLPPWIVKEGSEIQKAPGSETLSDEQLRQITWTM